VSESKEKEESIPEEVKPKPKPRSLALDALRGLAIVTMCLSGKVPKTGDPTLPGWMFHAQIGPLDNFRYPGGDAARAGYTWVDLVLPAFLFAMGCAFPLAMRSKLEKGVPKLELIKGIVIRFVTLVFFAIYVNNMNPWALSPITNWTWVIALASFAALFPLIGTLPKSLPKNAAIGTRVGGLILCVGFLMYSGYVRTKWGTGDLPADPGFIGAWTTNFWTVLHKVKNYSDIIIMLLANCALFGSIIYLFTTKNFMLRLGLMALVFAMWRTMAFDGHWVNVLTTNQPFGINLSWFYNFGYLKYLMLVIPGSIIGDLVYEWMQVRKKEMQDPDAPLLPQLSLCKSHYIVTAAITFLIVVLFHIGYQAREMEILNFGERSLTWIMATPFLIFALMGFVWHLIWRGKTETDQLIIKMFQWGVFWLILGMAFEPLKGGIKKDPSDVTYYFSSAGLSIMLLISFFIIIDVYGKKFGFRLLIWNGQNPMIAYMGIRNIVEPIFFFKFLPQAFVSLFLQNKESVKEGLHSIQTLHDLKADEGNWSGWARLPLALLKTYVLTYIVGIFTRLKIYWKS